MEIYLQLFLISTLTEADLEWGSVWGLVRLALHTGKAVSFSLQCTCTKKPYKW